MNERARRVVPRRGGSVIVLGLAIAFGACGDHASTQIPTPAMVPVAPITRIRPATRPERPMRFVGVLTAAESVDVAPRVAGVIAAVRVSAGDEVEEGQIVAELDRVQLQLELQAAQAALAAAGAALVAASVDHEDARRRRTVESRSVKVGISPAQSLEEAQFATQRAEAVLHRARAAQAAEAARAEAARDQLAAGHLRAPFAGKVAARYRDAGNRIEAGAPIVRIDRRGGTWVRFAVPPDDASRMTASSPVTVTVETFAAPLTGVVAHISPTVDPASGMIFVEAELAPTDGGAEQRSGLAAWVTPATPASAD